MEFPGPHVNIKGMIIYMYLIGLETRWRPGGDSSPRDVCWRLAGYPGPVAGNSNMIFGDLFPVSSKRLGDVSATSPRPAGDQGDWGDVAATMRWRSGRIGCHLVWRRRLGESASHFRSPGSPELPRLIGRGDVSANKMVSISMAIVDTHSIVVHTLQLM